MNKGKSRELDMTHGSLGDKILIFALPLAATGILQQLFNAADVAVVGQFAGKNAMAAVGSNSPVVSLMLSLFLGVSLGANVVISKYTGQRNEEGVKKAVHTAVLLAVICGVAMTIIGEIAARPLLHLMQVPDEVMNLSVLYLRIYLIGMPVILLYNFESAIFRSQGDTRTPLMCLIASGITNVVLNLFFVLICGMSVDGVATATVIANCLSSGLLFYFLHRSKSHIRVRVHDLKLEGKILAEIIRIGVPAGFQGMLFSISNVIIQSGVNSLGADVMAASSAAFNIEIFCFYLVNAFGQACTTFIGQNYGAGDIKRCRKVTLIGELQNIVVALMLSALILIFARQLLQFFNSDPIVVKVGIVRLKYIVTFEFVNGTIEVMSGALRGYGESLTPALVTFLGICGVRIFWVATAFAAKHTFDVLMMSYPISWFVTTAVLFIVYFLQRDKLRHKVERIEA